MPLFSPGERVVRCLLGYEIDRVPFGVGLGWSPWGETLTRWRRETGNPQLQPERELGFDLSFALPRMHSGIFPEFKPVVLDEDDAFIVRRDERGITTRNRKDGGSMPEFLDYPVKSEADWQVLKRERFSPAQSNRIVEDWGAFKERLNKTGEAVQVGCFPYGVFGTARDLLGAEMLLVSFYDSPELVQDIMQHLTTLWLTLWEQVADQVQISHIHIWEDMAGKQGSLISPQMVTDFMMPCYDRIAEFARRRGVGLISVDSDGNCEQLVSVMTRHGVNVFFPFEVQAGSNILDYRRQYPQLGILGGLDKRALAENTRALDVEINRCAEMLATGRYVPSFDHLIPPDVPWEAYRYAAQRISELCLTRNRRSLSTSQVL